MLCQAGSECEDAAYGNLVGRGVVVVRRRMELRCNSGQVTGCSGLPSPKSTDSEAQQRLSHIQPCKIRMLAKVCLPRPCRFLGRLCQCRHTQACFARASGHERSFHVSSRRGNLRKPAFYTNKTRSCSMLASIIHMQDRLLLAAQAVATDPVPQLSPRPRDLKSSLGSACEISSPSQRGSFVSQPQSSPRSQHPSLPRRDLRCPDLPECDTTRLKLCPSRAASPQTTQNYKRDTSHSATPFSLTNLPCNTTTAWPRVLRR